MAHILQISWALLLLAACGPAERGGLVVQTSPYSLRGETILIEHFEFNPVAAQRVDPAAVKELGELMAMDIQRSLKESGFQKAIVIGPGEKVEGGVLLTGRIVRVDGGSAWQRRLFEIFGVGATEVKVAGEMANLPDSTAPLGFFFAKRSHYSWEGNEAAIRRNIREIARDVVREVLRTQDRR
ncbi:MAG TPA: DUF4410 domain-containing protein [Thermodesulfobacteriota bacterium]|nr:DUF4410 domain-containing protein [Thermodesulfobacteriota bacterium]